MIITKTKKILIGTINELPEQLGKTVKIDDEEIAVFKLSNGSIRAVENRCPHKNGVLTEGIVSGIYVFDPLYDWKISLEDGQVQEPNVGSIKTYKTVVETNGDVYLVLEGLNFVRSVS